MLVHQRVPQLTLIELIAFWAIDHWMFLLRSFAGLQHGIAPARCLS